MLLSKKNVGFKDKKFIENFVKQLGEEEFDLVSASPGPHEELTGNIFSQ